MSNLKKHHFQSVIESRRYSQHSLAKSFHQAQSIAGILAKSNDAEIQNLLRISEQMIAFVESKGSHQEKLGTEPAYHNRQHFADTILAMGFYLQDLKNLSDVQKLLLLLTMLCHDFGHVGAANKSSLDHSQEEETIRLLRNTPVNQLQSDYFELIAKLIRGTEQSYLAQNRANYINHPENLEFLMQSLVNDADISPSFIDSLCPQLSKLILIELGNGQPSAQEIDVLMTKFKHDYDLSTSIARSYYY
ncbi:hypothetical protein FD977_02755 [Polynucleobacter sp. AP-Elch-400A-B2]|uniref:hypothetical protein n=1 Tax=Polynucleobacter sp. AP-Elch-400A-B2 TaxID=2576930 RepID=UPI001BFD1DB0|nr:hypothetical protein [Polynucleobacter sp. AP-Elch-400A-B2]QWE25199.1 hypothetical protein FD977_02755 [Polynucleobacter sp. AP-Elch-400A-B2]